MKKIICEINLFSFKQKVFLIDEDNKETQIATVHFANGGIDRQLLALGEEYEVNHYHLFGIPQIANKIAEQMRNPEVSTYSMRSINNDIIVEVN